MQASQADKVIDITGNAHRSNSGQVLIQAAGHTLVARLEEENAPNTCALFRRMLPLQSSLVHCRWSGESMWVPFEPPAKSIPFENHTSHPAPGQVLIYAQEFSEPEILMPYGACAFSSKVGQLAGNHMLTLVEGTEHLRALGHSILWGGAKEIAFRLKE